MSLSVSSIKIIDSYNFLPMPLSALPKALGIDEICKGYFPHLVNKFNTTEETTTHPDAYFYQPADMKPKAYTAFMDWYKQQKDKVKLFKKLIIK